jgi:hypothetical protein
MKSIPQKSKLPGDKTAGETATVADLAGVLPARDGLQPITDLDAFLESLPDFGADATRLREAIAAERALRRAAVEADCPSIVVICHA